MRPKVPKGRKAVTKTVSFLPAQLQQINTRMRALGVSFSGYLQVLVEHDIAHDTARQALVARLSKEAA